MFLLVDYRERWCVQKLQESLGSEIKTGQVHTTPDVSFCVKSLDVGDFVITDDAEATKMIIERKTVADLCSSIVDGRFRQQKDRLTGLTNGTDIRVVYIIEGTKKQSRLASSTLNSAVQNLFLKHNFFVLHSENQEDTFEHLYLLYKKASEITTNTACAPVAPTTVTKKGKNIEKHIMPLQLSVIPGVSFATALVIASVYPTMKELVMAYEQCDSQQQCFALLANLKMNERRKVGKALSEKIYKMLT